ncbi:MAG: glutamine-hydrolyzing GMP synthase, partial [Silvanigrellaceae bacterium]|nr:glutamine-hydrolyzing GMP synthase [Silvanigrellaceae bacterium]
MILVIDFGSQFTQLVARRIRELSVYSEIVPFTSAKERISELKKQKLLSGVIFSGGPHSVYENNSPKIDLNIETLEVPVLGICYGLQLINFMLGGTVAPSKNREYGFEKIIVEKNIQPENPLYKIKDIEENIVWMSHGDEIKELSSKLTVDSVTRNNVISSFHHKNLPIFGVQFHPEVEHSKYGRDLIKSFVQDICKDKKEWDSSLQIERAVELIKEKVTAEGPDTQVICALSGGVDSCVAAVLTQKAIGDKLLCLFINNGLLRKNEYDEVLARFKKDLNLNVKGVDA